MMETAQCVQVLGSGRAALGERHPMVQVAGARSMTAAREATDPVPQPHLLGSFADGR